MGYQTVPGRKVRFAVVGCGQAARDHFEAIETHRDRCEVVDVCDVSPDALATAIGRTGAKGHTTLSGLLAATTADCIVLTTPGDLQPPQAAQISGSGRHVVMESPLATNWKDGRSILDACEAAGVRLFVVEKKRPDATLRRVKQAIKEKRFGPIYAVAFNVSGTLPPDGDSSGNEHDAEQLDGPLIDLARRHIDLLDWLIGPVESVMAFKATLARAHDIEGSKVIALRWRSGALGTLNMTFGTYPHHLPNAITILGESGTVRLVGAQDAYEIQHWDFADGRSHETDREPDSSPGFAYGEYYDNVIKTLRGEAAPETKASEKLKSLELATAVYLSARDGKRIALPLFP